MRKRSGAQSKAKKTSRCFERILADWENRENPESRCYCCPLAKHFNGPTFGVGRRKNPIVMAVGESPNEEPRDKDGTAEGVRKDVNNFWKNAIESPKGEWRKMAYAFDEIFEDFEGRKKGIYFTNMWKCTNKEIRRSKKDSIDVLRKCGKHLATEIQAVSPKLIVVFGKKAFEGMSWMLDHEFKVSRNPLREKLAKKSNFPDVEGRLIPVQELKTMILPAFHWSRGEGNSSQVPGKKGYRDRIRKEIALALKGQTCVYRMS